MTLTPSVRISSFGLYFPGEVKRLDTLPLTFDENKRLGRLGQVFTHISDEDSTVLMVEAGRRAILSGNHDADRISMVISAPSLITSYGLEIPSVAVKASLGLSRAQCLNIVQGCVGVLSGIHLAAQLLVASPNDGDIMVVTSCRASSHTRNMTHGAFFWGDAAAAVVLSSSPGPGPTIAGYHEVSNTANWGAMRIPFGDAVSSNSCDHSELIEVNFETTEAQFEYIRSEQTNFATVVDGLLSRQALGTADVEAIFLPSTGKNRVPVLLSGHRELSSRVQTDFQFAHFGGVDPILALNKYINNHPTGGTGWLMAVSPAFSALWGGLLLRANN
jgi:3-oxoacyl-[acyl-carrier-protein] synthase III